MGRYRRASSLSVGALSSHTGIRGTSQLGDEWDATGGLPRYRWASCPHTRALGARLNSETSGTLQEGFLAIGGRLVLTHGH